MIFAILVMLLVSALLHFMDLPEIILPVLSFVLAVLIGIYLASSCARSGHSGIVQSRCLFLLMQFGFTGTLLAAALMNTLDRSSSTLSIGAWSLSAVFLLTSALGCSSRGRALVTLESVILFFVFEIPTIVNLSNYHGDADVFYHLGIVRELEIGGLIPVSDYHNWPVWHVGVASLSQVSGIAPVASAFLFVGSAMLLAVPFVGGLVKRLSRKDDLSAISSVVIVANPMFLLWFGYLAPTSLCLGLFLVLIWIASKGNKIPYSMLFLVIALTLVLSHHLSALIVVLLMLAIALFVRTNPKRVDRLGEISIEVAHPVIMATLMIAYWTHSYSTMFNRMLVLSNASLERLGSSPALSSQELLLNWTVLAFWPRAFAFVVIFFVTLVYLKRSGILGIGMRTCKAILLVSLLVFGTSVTYVVPISFFGAIEFHRWALFAAFGLSITSACVIILIVRLRRGRWLMPIVAFFLFLTFLSSAAFSSLDSLPFRENHFGQQPRPYFFDSEMSISSLTSMTCEGTISVDQVFSYSYFIERPRNQINVDSTFEGFDSENGTWLIRLNELADRGLQYVEGTEGTANHFVSEEEVYLKFSTTQVNCIADSGSTLLMSSVL